MRATLNGEITLPCTGLCQCEDGLACFTLDCGGLQGITWVCWELLDNTWDYMGLRGLIGISENYLEILGITWDY